ncbi:MAG: FecR domain-containing protein [Xylophilus ampelinus]
MAARAIAWAVQLRSGDATESDRAAFDAWRRADPAHAAAAERLQRALACFQDLPADPAPRQALRRSLAAPGRRKALGGTLGLAIAGGAAGTVLWSGIDRPLRALGADFATGTGERRIVDLADGSRLWLDARSAVDQVFDASVRRLDLRAGALIVEVARDRAMRPFAVHTAQGRVEAAGTRFLVRRDPAATLVAVLHSAVRIFPTDGDTMLLHQGQSARFTAREARRDPLEPRAASAWEDGFVEVHDRPLQEVVDAMRPYHPGVLRVSPQAAVLRVTGSFPLDDSARAFAALARVLPIAVHRRTGWWTSIDAR